MRMRGLRSGDGEGWKVRGKERLAGRDQARGGGYLEDGRNGAGIER